MEGIVLLKQSVIAMYARECEGCRTLLLQECTWSSAAMATAAQNRKMTLSRSRTIGMIGWPVNDSLNATSMR